jgi:hypothetical protein
VDLVGEERTAEIFAKAFWYVTIGSNDYINNYLLTNSATSKQYTPEQYQDVLIATFNQQLRVSNVHSSLCIFPSFFLLKFKI